MRVVESVDSDLTDIGIFCHHCLCTVSPSFPLCVQEMAEGTGADLSPSPQCALPTSITPVLRVPSTGMVPCLVGKLFIITEFRNYIGGVMIQCLCLTVHYWYMLYALSTIEPQYNGHSVKQLPHLVQVLSNVTQYICISLKQPHLQREMLDPYIAMGFACFLMNRDCTG